MYILTFGKISAQSHTLIILYMRHITVTIILTHLNKEQAWIELESQNVYIINVGSCAEILP